MLYPDEDTPLYSHVLLLTPILNTKELTKYKESSR